MVSKMTILLIVSGLTLLIFGLVLGLKQIKPVHMNVISGVVIVIGTFFGLFGKQLQDLSSSEKSDNILKTGQNTNEKIDGLNTQNFELKVKADSLSSKLEIQSETIDRLRVENTDLYFKLASSQGSILENTERTLQPLSINYISTSISYDFDNPIIQSIKYELIKLKNEIEIECSKYTPSVNGQRKIPAYNGISFFPDENNKITYDLLIQNQDIINKLNFKSPNLTFQIFNKLPSETKTKQTDGTFIITPDYPSLELNSYEGQPIIKVQNISIDFTRKKITILLSGKEWHYTKDNGEISSFKDLFGKYLKVLAYYGGYTNNQSKIEIVSTIIINDKKRLQFTFDKNDKSNATIEYNAAYLKKLMRVIFINENFSLAS